jgi:predicted nucleic acid-binding protein
MNAYADTGFVISLYKAETTSARASEIMCQLDAPVLLSQLGELELRNALQLSIFRGELSMDSATHKKQLFLEDKENGIFSIPPVPASNLFPKAAELAEKYSAHLGTRSLDLMHVAAALLLSAETFLSFDERQRSAAKAEGLNVLP